MNASDQKKDEHVDVMLAQSTALQAPSRSILQAQPVEKGSGLPIEQKPQSDGADAFAEEASIDGYWEMGNAVARKRSYNHKEFGNENDQLRVKDNRKCDYEIQNVDAPIWSPRSASRPLSAHRSVLHIDDHNRLHPTGRARSIRSRSFSHNITRPTTPFEEEEGESEDDMHRIPAWRQYLEMFVLQLLQEIRFHPRELRVFLKHNQCSRRA